MKPTWMKSLFNRTPSRVKLEPEETEDGDMHSGPYGYTPNEAYPETQYGSGFDEEADWNEEER
tara:strand:- start:754 stop:942 length:189 start_codon:yes stop_codon:yes gene_type:complete